jgi:hypothetical protein
VRHVESPNHTSTLVPREAGLMNLESTVEFLERIYEHANEKNLTRLEHEAVGTALK